LGQKPTKFVEKKTPVVTVNQSHNANGWHPNQTKIIIKSIGDNNGYCFLWQIQTTTSRWVLTFEHTRLVLIFVP
jgi:hypothetical protein